MQRINPHLALGILGAGAAVLVALFDAIWDRVKGDAQ